VLKKLTANKFIEMLQINVEHCDVKWDNPAYGGIKRTYSCQTPRVLFGVWSEAGHFVTYEHLQTTIKTTVKPDFPRWRYAIL